MAYLSASDLNDIQQLNATDEKRFSPLGLVDAAKDSSEFVDYISPDTKEKMSELSSSRDAQIPVIKDQTVTVTTSPSFTIPTNLPESAQYSFTAVDIFSGFRIFPASYEHNAIGYEWEKQRRMKAVLYAMGQTKEGLIESTLSTRKTQVLGFTTQVSQGDGTFTFDTGTDILTVSKAAQKETMFGNLDALMYANDLGGGYRLVTSRAGTAVQKSELLKYGAGNDYNLQALKQMGIDRMYESNTLAAGSDNFNGYFLRDGSIGLIENFPWDFRNGTSFAGKTWSVSDMEMPFTRSKINVYVNNEAVDATSLISSSNMQMTSYQEMALWDRFYIVYPYNSDLSTRASDIVKIKGATS